MSISVQWLQVTTGRSENYSVQNQQNKIQNKFQNQKQYWEIQNQKNWNRNYAIQTQQTEIQNKQIENQNQKSQNWNQ